MKSAFVKSKILNCRLVKKNYLAKVVFEIVEILEHFFLSENCLYFQKIVCSF